MNALRRVDAGQRGGAAFQFFHGLGVLYLHYPLYRLFGGGLAGSELARQFLSILAYPALFVLYFRAFTRDWLRTLLWSVIVYAVSIALGLYAVLTPSVSMLGLRASMPIIAVVVMGRLDARRFRSSLIGVVLGAALLFGTEQGVALIVAFIGVGAIAAARSPARTALVLDVVWALAIACVAFCVPLLVLGGLSGLRGSLHYNFVVVGQNQFWYYGIPPNTFAATWRDTFAMMRQMPLIPITLAAIIVFVGAMVRRVWRARGDSPTPGRDRALATFAVYGLLSCASLGGMFYHTYVHPCARVVLLLAALEIDGRLGVRTWRPPRIVDPRLAVGAAAAIALMFLRAPLTRRAADWTMYHVITYHLGQARGLALTGMWPAAMKDAHRIVDAHRGPAGQTPAVWSTYSGLLEDELGSFNPSSFDYTLHALGADNRERYLVSLQATKPQLVQTVRPSYSSIEIWMLQTSWDFYRVLLQNYQVRDTTSWSSFWERSADPTPAPAPVWSFTVPAGATSVKLPAQVWRGTADSITVLDVTLAYRATNPFERLPLIGKMPRYFVSPRGATARYPVSLDPSRTTASFPIVLRRGQLPMLDFQVFSLLPGARLEVRSVRVALVAIRPTNEAWLAELARAEDARGALGPGGDSTGAYRWR